MRLTGNYEFASRDFGIRRTIMQNKAMLTLNDGISVETHSTKIEVVDGGDMY